MLKKLWLMLLNVLELLQKFLTASCFPGLDSLDDEDEEAEKLLQEEQNRVQEEYSKKTD